MSVKFCTKFWEWEIDEDGNNRSLCLTGQEENLCVAGEPFAWLSMVDETTIPQARKTHTAPQWKKILPVEVRREGDLVTVRFDAPTVEFSLAVEEKEASVIFRVQGVSPADAEYGQFVFGGARRNGAQEEWFFSTVMHHLEVHALEIPGYCETSGAYVTHTLGEIGKAAEVLFCRKEEMRDRLKEICGKLSLEDVIVSPLGGAFSDACTEATLNYAEVSGENIYDLEKFLAPHEHLGINLYDIGHGVVFRQGDMTFLAGTAEKFRREFVDELHRRGKKVGLHIYGAMIANDSQYVAPVPHEDLAVVDFFTLREDLTEEAEELFLCEDTDTITMVQQHAPKTPRCFRIDDELIRFDKRGDNGRVYDLVRGAFGTKATAHKKGAQIRQLARNFEHFHPMPGSALYREVAANTARLYNEGDFDLIYVDGLDVSYGLYRPSSLHWLPDSAYGNNWYYAARFVQDILKDCKKTPMLEYSMLNPSLWAGRSRAGTFDTFFTGYKAAIDYHCRCNEKGVHSRLLTSQLGWYDFYPMAFEYDSPYFSTYISAYEFPEDVEYLGQKVIAFDSAVSSLSYDAKKHPEMSAKRTEHEKILARYSRLKEAGVISPTVKEALKSEEHCYRLVETEGKAEFVQWKRMFGYPYSLREGENSLRVDNPFASQKPFLRLLCTHTAEENEGSFVVAHFDKNIPANQQMGVVDLRPGKDELLDLRGQEALGVWVKGNNSEEVMNIGLLAAPQSRVFLQSMIPLNFDGWRYFTLCEKDTNEATLLSFRYGEEAQALVDSLGYHSFYQPTPCYDQVYALFFGFTGEGEGVRLGDISAICPKKAVVKDPSVEIGGERITFRCELAPTEYIEYRGGDKADVLDVCGINRQVPAEGNHPTLQTGENTVCIGGEGEGVRRIKAYFVVEGDRLSE